MLYNKYPDNKTKRPDWSKGVVTDIDSPGRKYKIENDAGKNVTRTRHDQMDPMLQILEGSLDLQVI